MASPVAARPRTIAERFEEAFPRSRELYARASDLFPNGVTHDARYLEPFPVYVDRAKGSHKWDADGHELIDWWSGHGSILLGHSHPRVVEAVTEQMRRMTHPSACHELEVEWGEIVRRLKPSVEKLRFVNSGTEATMMALRLARTFTGRPKVLKFRGHFHGWHDFLIQAADPPYDRALPGLGGGALEELVIVPPNDPEALERTLERDKEIACAIIEPTGGHFGQVPIRGEFLKSLRDTTARHGVLLIFDEVITGFRVAPGGAQGHYAIRPDLTTMAKVLAGGLPGGCVGGRGDILELLAFGPAGNRKMPHPGTFNANPLSASAGIATLEIVAGGDPCRRANDAAARLRRRLNELFASEGLRWAAYGDFSDFRILTNYTGPRPASGDDRFLPYGGDFERLDAKPDPKLNQMFRLAMFLYGIDLPGLRGMANAAHTDEDLDQTIEAVRGAIGMLREERLC